MAPTPEKIRYLRELNDAYRILYNSVQRYNPHLNTLNMFETPNGFADRITGYEERRERTRGLGANLEHLLENRIRKLHAKALRHRIPVDAELIVGGVPAGGQVMRLFTPEQQVLMSPIPPSGEVQGVVAPEEQQQVPFYSADIS